MGPTADVGLRFSTFAFQEVERTEKANVATGRGLRSLVAQELGKLCPGEVDEAGDVTQDQLQEHLRVLVAELFHKKVGVKDDWSAGTAAPQATVHPADGTGGRRRAEQEVTSLFVLTCLSDSSSFITALN